MKQNNDYNDKLYRNILDAPMYRPHGSVAFSTGGLLYLLGMVFFGQCIRARRYNYIVVSLIALVTGSEFIARGVYTDEHALDSRAYVASMVLNELGPCLTVIPNTLLLMRLLTSTVLAPCKGTTVSRGAVLAISSSVLFSALVIPGMLLASKRQSEQAVKAGARLVWVATVGQAVSTLLLVTAATWLVVKHHEMRRRMDWVTVVFVGAVLMLLRFILRSVQILSLSFIVHRRHESGWYCLDPIFMFAIVFMWTAVDISARFSSPQHILIRGK